MLDEFNEVATTKTSVAKSAVNSMILLNHSVFARKNIIEAVISRPS